jgi:cytochrome c oxidase subunit 2
MSFLIYTDYYATPWQLLFQSPATPVMEGIICLHHDLMFVLIIIASIVTWVLVTSAVLFTGYYPGSHRIVYSHAQTIEIVWTVTPSILLIFIGIPSFTLLYSMDEIIDPTLTLKVIGHQWYWSYEYGDFITKDKQFVTFDSYMLPEKDLPEGGLRLLEVDYQVYLPTNAHIRVLVTGADVIHSWAIPSFGIKMDAIPGRLNQVALYIKNEGVFYGQCSELCGINHGFMPIVVIGVPRSVFLFWLNNWLNNNL